MSGIQKTNNVINCCSMNLVIILSSKYRHHAHNIVMNNNFEAHLEQQVVLPERTWSM